jgi:hypothetical protein
MTNIEVGEADNKNEEKKKKKGPRTSTEVDEKKATESAGQDGSGVQAIAGGSASAQAKAKEADDDPFDDKFDDDDQFGRNRWYVKVDAVGFAEMTWKSKKGEVGVWWVPFVLPSKWFARTNLSYHSIACTMEVVPGDLDPRQALAGGEIVESVFLVHRCKWTGGKRWDKMDASTWLELGMCSVVDSCLKHSRTDCVDNACSKASWTPQHHHSANNKFWVLHDRSTGYYSEY